MTAAGSYLRLAPVKHSTLEHHFGLGLEHHFSFSPELEFTQRTELF